jgi:Protein of unknown function (DUF998)
MNTPVHHTQTSPSQPPTTPETPSAALPPRRLPMAALITLVGVLVFIIATIAAHLVRTDLNPLIEPVSLYALGGTGWIMTTAKTAVGLAGLAVAASARGLSVPGRVCLALWAVMSLTATLFPMDAPGMPATMSGAIHEWAGFDFIFGIAAALLFARSFKRGNYGIWGKRARVAAWCLTASGISLIIFMGALHGLNLGGLAQRVDWVVFLTWLTTVQMAIVSERANHTENAWIPVSV